MYPGVGHVSGQSLKTDITGTGNTTMDTAKTLRLDAGSSPPAGNLITFNINKTGTDGLYLGVNKNTTTGSVPANATFISTYSASGKIALGRGNGAGNANTVDLYIDGSGNIAIGSAGSFGSGVKVISIANATTLPSANPTGGGILYVDTGALKYRGSSGTVTTIAVA